MKKHIVPLTEEERKILAGLVSKGKYRSQKILNALTLLVCDDGEHPPSGSKNEEIARVPNTSIRKIDRVKKRFVLDGLDVAVSGREGSRIYEK
jgi:hypothetical protein